MTMSLEDRIVYSAIGDRPKFTWPGGAGLAVWFACNTEHYEFIAPSPQAWPRVPQPDVQGYSFREFGNRVGFWRLAELLAAGSPGGGAGSSRRWVWVRSQSWPISRFSFSTSPSTEWWRYSIFPEAFAVWI